MRRVLVLVVAAAAIAVGAGLAIPSSAVTVNHESLSQSQLNDELAAIAASPYYQCFLQAQAYLNGLAAPTPIHGVSAPSWFSTPTVEWSNTRTTDLAIVQYVQVHDPAAFTPANLATARTDLGLAIYSTIGTAYSQGSSAGFSCAGIPSPPTHPSDGAAVLNTMPPWFQSEQVQANAAELALEHLIPSPLPTSGPGLAAWYHEHAGVFDTTCISLIESPSLAASQTVASAIANGLSFAAAASRYSKDPTTASKGGALGCFSPSSPQWSGVQHFAGAVPTGHVSPPEPIPNAPAYLLVLVTKRTPNTFQDVHVAVAAQNQAINRTNAQVLALRIQRAADISVSPAIGTWQPTASGGTILPPSQPPAPSVTNSSANVPLP